MTDIVITSAVRTPVGSFGGTLSTLPAHALGEVAIKEALKRSNLAGTDVSEVIMGQILTAAQGQNPARQASMAAGMPKEVPAWLVNMMCGSGLRTVALGAQAILAGDSTIVVAGGQESMSQSTHAQNLRNGHKMGDVNFIDTMIKDGLWDAFNGYHMGQTAENIAKQWQITREEQDAFAVDLAEPRRGGQESRTLQCRDRPGDHQAAQGRGDLGAGRIYPRRRHQGGDGGVAAGLRQRRHGHRRQFLGHQ